ncbi:hypothetical protein FOZ62_022295, partial [Perkinsus olseni]
MTRPRLRQSPQPRRTTAARATPVAVLLAAAKGALAVGPALVALIGSRGAAAPRMRGIRWGRLLSDGTRRGSPRGNSWRGM